MSLIKGSFQFGEFTLDTNEKVLLHLQKPVSLTPKAFLLLQTLVENHGHLVEKEELIRTIWPDSIVEEGNLSFTVNLLRKTLGDSKSKSRFIETVPKRGYRFVGEIIPEPETHNLNESRPAVQKEIAGKSKSRTLAFAVAVTLLILLVTIGVGSLYLSDRDKVHAPILSARLNIGKLSNSGVVHHAVISSDGEKVAYVNVAGRTQGVWIRDLEKSSNVEIVPQADSLYGGLAFSSDGSQLFFTRKQNEPAVSQLDLYRVAVSGGIPGKIVSETQGWMDVSPDGQKLSFVRCYHRDEEFCSLWIADAIDGKNERKLVSRSKPFRIGANKFSPDGKSVAFAVGQSLNQGNEFALADVDIETGTEREITPEKFFNINGLAWLPNRTGLLFTAFRKPNKHFRIWQLETNSGSVRPITNDSETYSELSLDAEAKNLVTTQVIKDFKINLFALDNPLGSPKFLADAGTADISPTDKVVFYSSQTGNDEIWKMDSDGTDQKQLTTDPSDDRAPVISADGRSIFFSSNRSGESQVWRMNEDGSSQTQITSGEGGFPRFISTDGWVYYLSGLRRSLRRVSHDGSQDQVIIDRPITRITFTQDGSTAAVFYQEGDKTISAISIPDGREIRQITIVDKNADLIDFDWAADGKELAYILRAGYPEQSTLWFHAIDTDKSRRVFDLGEGILSEQSSFNMFPDGKRFLVSKGKWRHDAVLFSGFK